MNSHTEQTMKGLANLCSTFMLTSPFKTLTHTYKSYRHSRLLYPSVVPLYEVLAAVAGFEPADEGVKVPCLTPWRYRYIHRRLLGGLFFYFVTTVPAPETVTQPCFLRASISSIFKRLSVIESERILLAFASASAATIFALASASA